MLKSLKINIPSPCHAKWSEMTPAEQGRFCMSCQKTVVDFTSKSKGQIIDFVTNNEGSVCGRFKNEQLGVELISPRPQHSYLKYTLLLFGLVPLLGKAQTAIPIDTTSQYSILNSKFIQSNTKQGKISVETDSIKRHSVKGKIIDAQSGEPIVFASIGIYNNHGLVGATDSDMDGNFELMISEGVYIEVNYIGFMDYKIDFAAMASTNFTLRIEMIESPIDISQIGIVGYERKYSIFDQIWKKFIHLVKRTYTETKANRNKVSDGLESKANMDENTMTIGQDKEISSNTLTISPKMTLYPNPTTGLVQVHLISSFESSIIQVTNLQNQIVTSIQITSADETADLTTYPSGIYIMSLIANNELIASEVVVKE